ncbi:MAG: PASTA domain-containing protein, partial [Bacteroidota bacterium]
YAQLLFRPKGSLASAARKTLRIKDSEEIPTKATFWVEEIPDQSWTPLLSSLYCSRNNEGEAEYEILAHSILQKNNTTTSASKELPAFNRPEVQFRLAQALEKIARLLNLQSFVTIESYLRIFADNSIQLMLSQVDALPLLTPDHPLLAHAMEAGRDPGQMFQEMYIDHLKQYLPKQKTTFEPTMVNNEDENKEVEQPITNDPPPELVQSDSDKEVSAIKKIWASIKAFLTAYIFWKNVGGIFAAGLLLFGLTLFLLGRYTLHGSSYIVDDYVDMKFDDAKRKARGKTFRAVVIDSIFITGAEPNLVTDQDPAPGSKVKKRRTIYMWVTGGQAPEILLPNLAGKDDYETYRRELERRNIRLVIKERKFDRKLQENTLLGFYYKGKNVSTEMVNEGFKVVEGSTLEAIVSERISDQLPIPNLVCETFEAAKFTIEGSRLVLGEVYGTRTNNAYVWKQEPAFEAGAQIKTGTVIKLHLTSERPEDCQ